MKVPVRISRQAGEGTGFSFRVWSYVLPMISRMRGSVRLKVFSLMVKHSFWPERYGDAERLFIKLLFSGIVITIILRE